VKMKSHLIIAVSLAFILISTSAGAVTVYVQYDGSTVQTGPALVSASGADFDVSANLQSGEFKGRAQGQGSTDQNAYSGSIFGFLNFTNNTGSQVVIGAGDFTARVQGDYTFGGGPNQSSVMDAFLQVKIAGEPDYVASARQIVAIGTLIGNPGSTFTPLFQTNGASVLLTTASTSQLIMDLVMPELTLAAGATMQVAWASTPLVNTDPAQGLPGNFAEADFFSGTNGLSLGLVLPAGVTLNNDSTVPLDWVTNAVPVPGAIWLFGSGLIGLMGLSKYKKM